MRQIISTLIAALLSFGGAMGVFAADAADKYDKYMHISFDDVYACLYDISVNNYNSVFENDFFKDLKDFHDTYGAVFTLNCFNTSTENAAYDISNLSVAYKNELNENSGWLKFAFHAENDLSNYGDANEGTSSDGNVTDDCADAIKASYNKFTSAIVKAAGADSIDTVVRLGYFAGTQNNVKALKECEYGITGLLSADDTRVSYYLSADANNKLLSCGEYYDTANDIKMIQSQKRLEKVSDISSELNVLSSYGGNIIEIFTHEQNYTDTVKSRLKKYLEWAKSNNCTFGYAADAMKERISAENIGVENGKQSYRVHVSAGETGYLISALYDGDRLIGIQNQAAESEQMVAFDVSETSENSTVKFFLWDGIDTMRFLSNAASIAVKADAPQSSLTLDHSTYPLYVGNSSITDFSNWDGYGSYFTLTASVDSEEYSENDVKWVIDDEKIAYLKSTSKNTAQIRARRTGMAKVTAYLPDGAKANCYVPVIDNASRLTVNRLELNTDKLNLAPSDTAKLTAIFYPKDIYNIGILNKSLSWQSSDTAVAAVDENGNVKAVGSGAALITATSADVGRTAQCTVTVTDDCTAIKISPVNTDIINMTVGDTKQLDNFGDTEVVWKSDNSYIADVDENGMVTAYSNSNVQNVSADGLTVTETEGTVKIYATAVNGGQTAEYQVCVASSDIADKYLEPSDGVFGKTEYTSTTKTTDLKITAKDIDVDEVYQIIPEADGDSKLLWIGTDENIASVDREGNVQGYSIGEITVYAIVDTLTDAEKTEFDALADTRTPDITRLNTLLADKTYAQCEIKVTDDTPCLRNVHIPQETITDTSVNILWNRASLSDTGDFAKYIVYQNGEKIIETTTLGYTANNLEAETEYIFKIAAVNENGDELASDSIAVTTKSAPSKILNVLDYGARGDGTTIDTYAIQKAINDCPKDGVVWLPSGYTFYSGALFLKSDMTFRVDGIILGSIDPKDYPRWVTKREGWRKTEQSASEWANSTSAVPDNHMPHSSLINAGKYDEGVYGMTGPYNVENLIICGNGQINANGFALAFNEGANSTYASEPWTSYDYPVKDPSMRGHGITIHNGQNIYIKDVTVAYSPSWTVHTINCDNITFDAMDVVSQGNGDVGKGTALKTCGHIPNGDGIDPESCTHANIFNVYFTTGDDAVAMKTGRNKEGNELNKPNAYIRVTDCTSSWSLGGFGTGSENAGGSHDLLFQNLTAENVRFYGIWLKTQETRGGTAENIQIRDMDVTVANAAISMNHDYGDPTSASSATNPADEKPILRNVTIENVTSSGTSKGIAATGLSSSLIRDIKIRNYVNKMSSSVESPLKYCSGFEIWDCVNTTFTKSNSSDINEYFTDVLEDTEIVKNNIAYAVQEISDGIVTVKPETTGTALIADITSSKGGEQKYSFKDAQDGDITDETVLTDGCKLIVTSPNSEKTAQYSITVKEAVNADITTLSIITDSGKELIFSDFSKTTMNYSVKAEKSTESITVNAVTDDGNALVVMKNNSVEFSDTVTLDENGNIITIDVTASDGSVSNTYTINIDNSYAIAENFETVTDAWGFEGNGGTSVTDGVMRLLTNKKTDYTVTKTLDEDISGAKKVSVEFDWKSNSVSGKGNGSWFALHDSSDNMIFALYGNGKYVGIGASTTNTGSGWETLESFSNDWYRASLTLDFESGTINGTITNITDDKIVKTYTNEPIQNGALNLGKLYAKDGYGDAVISLDNVYIITALGLRFGCFFSKLILGTCQFDKNMV